MAAAPAGDEAVGRAFTAALLARDTATVEGLLSSDAIIRAVIPGGLRERSGAGDVADLMVGWFADSSEITVLETASTMVGPRLSIRYRARVVEDGIAKLVEHVGYAWLENGQITQLHLLCSGFHPIPAPTVHSPTVHSYDAGDLGCGDGLPQEFRRRIRDIPVGDVLEVTARDPAAKADLPPLARLMGHEVISNDNLPDGQVRIVVERKK